MAKKKKNFVLDTNILLDDPYSFFKMGEHDVTIPMEIIAELDKFKTQSTQIGENARVFTRELDKLFSPEIFNAGVSLGHGKGKITLYILKTLNLEVKKRLKDDTPDHKIISAALNLQTKYNKSNKQQKEVVFVSNDINLRFKAASFGLSVEAYKNDRVEDLEQLYSGVSLIEDCTQEQVSQIFSGSKSGQEELIRIILDKNPKPNQCFILKNHSNSGLARFVLETSKQNLDEKKQFIHSVVKKDMYNGVKPRNAEQVFGIDVIMDSDINLVTFTGKAGTGKTLVAIGAALCLLDKKVFDQVLIARPIVALSNKDLGYLPGDSLQKISPYMQPLYDNISVLKKQKGEAKKASQKIDEYLENGKIVVEPLAFIRGRSLNNTLFIVDEAQNLTPREIKTIVTRMGENSKVVFTGDVHQIDHPYLDAHSNGLTYLVDRAKEFENAAHIEFKKGERSLLAEWAAENL